MEQDLVSSKIDARTEYKSALCAWLAFLRCEYGKTALIGAIAMIVFLHSCVKHMCNLMIGREVEKTICASWATHSSMFLSNERIEQCAYAVRLYVPERLQFGPCDNVGADPAGNSLGRLVGSDKCGGSQFSRLTSRV
jgi:hypothetical protein